MVTRAEVKTVINIESCYKKWSSSLVRSRRIMANKRTIKLANTILVLAVHIDNPPLV